MGNRENKWQYVFMSYIRENNRPDSKIVACIIMNTNTGKIDRVSASRVKDELKQNPNAVMGLKLNKSGDFMRVSDRIAMYEDSCRKLGIQPLGIDEVDGKFIITDVPSNIAGSTIQIPNFVDRIKVDKTLYGNARAHDVQNVSSINYIIPYIDRKFKEQNDALKFIANNSKKINGIDSKIDNILDNQGSQVTELNSRMNDIINKLGTESAEIKQNLLDISNWFNSNGQILLDNSTYINDVCKRISEKIDNEDKKNSLSEYDYTNMKGVEHFSNKDLYSLKDDATWNKAIIGIEDNFMTRDQINKIGNRLKKKLKYLNIIRQEFGGSGASAFHNAQSIDMKEATALLTGLVSFFTYKDAKADDGIVKTFAKNGITTGLISSVGAIVGTNAAGLAVAAVAAATTQVAMKGIAGAVQRVQIKKATGNIKSILDNNTEYIQGLTDYAGKDIVEFSAEEAIVMYNKKGDAIHRYQVGSMAALAFRINTDKVNTRSGKQVIQYIDLMMTLDHLLTVKGINNQKVLDIIIGGWLIADEYINSLSKMSRKDKRFCHSYIIKQSLCACGMVPLWAMKCADDSIDDAYKQNVIETGVGLITDKETDRAQLKSSIDQWVNNKISVDGDLV